MSNRPATRRDEGESNPADNLPQFGQLNGVPVDFIVEVGRTMATIGEVLSLRPGSTLSLDRPVSGAVDVIIAGKRLAAGEVVLIDDEIGVRITDFLINQSPDTDTL